MPNNTVRFSDFFAFLVAACFVAGVFVAPYIMAWHYLDSHFSRDAAHDSRPRAEGSWGLALPGAPNAPSRPRIAGPHTEGKNWAIQFSSGLEDSSRFGLFALTHRGDPRWEMGRGGASLEGAFGDGAAWSRSGINREAKYHGLGTYQGDGSEDTHLLKQVQPLNTTGDRMTLGAGIKPGHHLQTLHGPLGGGLPFDAWQQPFELGNASGSTPVRSTTLQTIANGAASLCGIDPALFWSLILRESSGRHWDAEGRVLRSRSNALGLGQIKASTARGVSPHLDAMDPWQNAVASACYLRQQFDRFGTWRKALHAYHRGPNARGKTPRASHDYAADIIQGSAQ